ncbi:DUF3482 domain-containing protein [Candidatus Uabimicrobium amorphum]|uniref:GTP-binding protein n=1 Tax=Uabimicrobium amorphum TaxID=2596890 RepID=A0A5S9F5V1_UABAM|nr:DUF3482 domain-containing protein [Candidatus Uabimicrobium amorphum]BBM86701.1 GTP-binding protein [Candidatus Uabimicrobium amorphum]
MSDTPVFIIMGQSNEGKSSIVSTLVGHDKVEVDHDAGTTKEYRVFPIEIDGERIMDFIDTPGFEHPKKILKWLRKNENSYENSKNLISAFCDMHHKKKNLELDCQLLAPIKNYMEACILYVFDGSRPVDQQDIWAMEIVSMSGCGRIALINCRKDSEEHIDKWKNECSKYFNSVKNFNAHRANFKDRVRLLTTMGTLVDNLADTLELVTENLKQQRDRLYKEIAEHISDKLRKCIAFSTKGNTIGDIKTLKQKLIISYKKGIEKIESEFRKEVRSVYRHRIFDVEIPQKSIINEELFSEETWSVLGLTKNQLTFAAAAGGTGIGLGISALLAPITGGASLAVGGLLGAAAAATAHFKGEDMFDVSVGKQQHVTIANKKIQFYYILVDRMILYYSYMVNRAHGKRVETKVKVEDGEKQGFTSKWTQEQQQQFKTWLQDTIKGNHSDVAVEEIIVPMLKEIDGKE